MTGGCCLNLTDATVRPDPLIYSQPYLMAQGLAVTWDNPDIELFEDGVAVSSSALKPDHPYEVQVRVGTAPTTRQQSISLCIYRS